MTGLAAAELLSRSEAREYVEALCNAGGNRPRCLVSIASDQASYVTGAIVPMDGGAGAVI